MAFSPTLTPGRADHLGHMQVPHDVFVHVTQNDGWSETIEDYEPITRQHYLESIKYWMELNGACIIRSASSSRFAAIKDIKQCATILYGRQNVDGDTDPVLPSVSSFTISVSPTSGVLPLQTVLTLVADSTHTVPTIKVNWGDTNESTVTLAAGETKTANHTYAIGTGPSKTVSVQAFDEDEAVGDAKTQVVSLTEPVQFAIDVDPKSGPGPLSVELTITKPSDPTVTQFFVQWGDGKGTDSVSGDEPVSHIYTDVGEHNVTVQPRNAGGSNVGSSLSVLVTVE